MTVSAKKKNGLTFSILLKILSLSSIILLINAIVLVYIYFEIDKTTNLALKQQK